MTEPVDAKRADGRRNYERVLDAARTAFAEHGTDVSLREVARRAGVGIGTLYRHFPTREALIEATMRQNLDSLTTLADELAAASSPGEALGTWLHAFAAGSTRYHGLPASILAALHDRNSELHRSCVAMRAAAARLVERARQSGEVRADIGAGDVLTIAAGIVWAGQQSGASWDLTARLLDVVRTGLAHPPTA